MVPGVARPNGLARRGPSSVPVERRGGTDGHREEQPRRARQGLALDSITKRDGRVVPFDAARITAAIAKAGAATGELGHDEAQRLCLRVLAIAGATLAGTPTVERIQDIVEEVLLASPHRRAARAYIVYREQHRALRAVSDAASVALVDCYLDRSDWQVAENANMAFSLQGLNNHLASLTSARPTGWSGSTRWRSARPIDPATCTSTTSTCSRLLRRLVARAAADEGFNGAGYDRARAAAALPSARPS